MLFFAVLELILWLAVPTRGPVYLPRPDLYWAMVPNLVDEPLVHRESGTTFRVTTNDDGLRTRIAPGSAPGAGSTVLWLGDSQIFGWGLEQESAPPQMLQLALDELLPGWNGRVINAAVPGFSSMQCYLLLESVGVGYAPDVVVFGRSGHDIRGAELSDRRRLDATGTRWLAYQLTRYCQTYRVLRRLLLPVVAERDSVWRFDQETEFGAPEVHGDQVRVPPRDYRSLLRAAGSLGREHGFQVLVGPSQPGNAPPEYRDVLEQAERAGDIRVLDYLHDVVPDDDWTSRYRLRGDPGHYNADGSRMLAERLATALIEDGAIGSGGPGSGD